MVPRGSGFELVGGDAALDFVNTIHDWTESPPRDHLQRFADALRFGEAAGVLSRADVLRLTRRRGVRELSRLRALRAVLERVFRAIVTTGMPAREDLGSIMSQAAAAARAARLAGQTGRVVRVVDPDAAGIQVLRYRLAEAAVALITSPRLERVKACPACGWFFVDTSKNRSRRWCSMRTCGSIDKARRYYRRTRARRHRGAGGKPRR